MLALDLHAQATLLRIVWAEHVDIINILIFKSDDSGSACLIDNRCDYAEYNAQQAENDYGEGLGSTGEGTSTGYATDSTGSTSTGYGATGTSSGESSGTSSGDSSGTSSGFGSSSGTGSTPIG